MNVIEKMLTSTDQPKTGKIITAPTLLSECGELVTLDKKDKYNIEIEPGNYLVISIGFTVGKPGARYTHPNIALTHKTVHDFKYYRKTGSKFWTSRAGINHILIVPRSQVKLLPEKGYSYIHAEINGAKVMFNVSGGGGGGWTDYLNTFVTICVNHKLADLKKIAEVCVRNSPFEPLKAKPLTPEDEERWNSLSAKATPNIKEKIAKMIEEGKKPVIHFLGRLSYEGNTHGIATGVGRRYKKIPQPPMEGYHSAYKLEPTGALREIILDMGWNGVRAKISQIDWYKTAKENAISA